MRPLPALPAVACAAALSVLAGACRGGGDDGARERYLEARRSYGAIFARTLDASCPEEPACAGIVAALAGVPADHPDAPEARKVLARIERARAERAEDRVPDFLGGGEPRLPEPDEVPAFLQERIGPAAGTEQSAAPGAPAGADPAAAPTAGEVSGEAGPTSVLVDGGEGGAGDDTAEAGPTPVLVVDGGEGGAGDDTAEAGPTPVLKVDGGEADDDPAPPADPCAELRARLAKRKDWLARTAAERNTIAHVIDPADHAALLQLRTMHRCQEHPDDPDCVPPPIEVDVSDLQVPLSRVTREPGELVAEGRDPDDLPHDPVVHELEGQLRKCEAEP